MEIPTIKSKERLGNKAITYDVPSYETSCQLTTQVKPLYNLTYDNYNICYIKGALLVEFQQNLPLNRCNFFSPTSNWFWGLQPIGFGACFRTPGVRFSEDVFGTQVFATKKNDSYFPWFPKDLGPSNGRV